MLVGCLTSQQHARVSQGRICEDNFTCCHSDIQVADPTVYLTQSQYTDTGPTSPSADPITPGAFAGYSLGCQFLRQWYDSTPKNSQRKRDSNPGSSAVEADALTTRPTRRLGEEQGVCIACVPAVCCLSGLATGRPSLVLEILGLLPADPSEPCQ